MALTGLQCPTCRAELHDGATRCYRCEAPIGKKQWKQALDNEYLKAYEKHGFFSFVRRRIAFSIRFKVFVFKRFMKALDAGLRRQFVRFI